MQTSQDNPALPARKTAFPAHGTKHNGQVLANQLRVGSGHTHAPGLLNPETGRLSWQRMCGLLGIPRCVARQRAQESP